MVAGGRLRRGDRARSAGGLRPKALVCLNDRIALGTYQALAEAGLRVPDDVSVVSFDDSELASWLRPALSTIALPEFEMGRLAVGPAARRRAGRRRRTRADAGA